MRRSQHVPNPLFRNIGGLQTGPRPTIGHDTSSSAGGRTDPYPHVRALATLDTIPVTSACQQTSAGCRSHQSAGTRGRGCEDAHREVGLGRRWGSARAHRVTLAPAMQGVRNEYRLQKERLGRFPERQLLRGGQRFACRGRVPRWTRACSPDTKESHPLLEGRSAPATPLNVLQVAPLRPPLNQRRPPECSPLRE